MKERCRWHLDAPPQVNCAFEDGHKGDHSYAQERAARNRHLQLMRELQRCESVPDFEAGIGGELFGM